MDRRLRKTEEKFQEYLKKYIKYGSHMNGAYRVCDDFERQLRYNDSRFRDSSRYNRGYYSRSQDEYSYRSRYTTRSRSYRRDSRSRSRSHRKRSKTRSRSHRRNSRSRSRTRSRSRSHRNRSRSRSDNPSENQASEHRKSQSREADESQIDKNKSNLQETLHPDSEKASTDVSKQPPLSSVEIFELFGKPVYESKEFAPEIIPDLALRWEQILTKGLPDETLTEIVNKYPAPKNCPLFEAPKINELVQTIMQENIIMKDSRIQKRQNKISALLSSVASVISIFSKIKDIPDWKIIMEKLGDASKLIADLQHDESIIRRNLLISNVNGKMKDTVTS